MISRIQGVLVHKTPPVILVDVHGVGYEIFVSMQSLYELPSEGQAVSLHTHLIIREDAHTLFGFIHQAERALFKNLLKVNGVGPKSALAILSSCSVTHFNLCIEHEDLSSLIKIPGIGRKTAERLIIEMRGQSTGSLPMQVGLPHSARNDAISALVSLGYKPNEAGKMIASLDCENKSSEVLIREALRQI